MLKNVSKIRRMRIITSEDINIYEDNDRASFCLSHKLIKQRVISLSLMFVVL